MNLNNPFDHQGFKTFFTELINRGYKFIGVIEGADGSVRTFGDKQVGLQLLSREISNEKRKSNDWLGDPSDLKKLRVPMSQFKGNDAQTEAPAVLRHFIGKDRKYGEGNCYLWDHTVKVDSLIYSKKCLTKFIQNYISLSDLIDWSI